VGNLNWPTTKCALTRRAASGFVPLAAVLAIYARENGAGTMFEPEAAYDEEVAS
jgi:stringent starvation protein B